MPQLRQEANKIKKNSAQTKDLLNKTKSEQNATQQEINKLDAELNKVTAALIESSKKLDRIKLDLEKNEKELAEAKIKKEKQYEAYKKRVRFLYENGKNAYIRSIFKAHDFHDLLKRTEYINRIIKYDSELFDSLKALENEIKTKTEAIKVQQEQVKLLVDKQKKQKADLETQEKSKEELMQKLNSNLERYQAQLKDLERSSSNIEKLIRQAQEQAAAAAKQNKKSSGTTSSAQSNFNYTGGKLGWPVPGRTSISSGYGGRTSPIKGGSEFHTGLDIPAPRGTPIHAAESGVVINSGNINGYGYTIIISHGNGLSTLYGHNSSLAVKVGQQVKRGDVIAYAGMTGYATGNHCHFEVRINGRHTNPWNYLR